MKRVEKDLLSDERQEFSAAEAIYNNCTGMREYHYHRHYEILYITHHCRILQAGGKEYQLTPDCVALIPPLTPHRTGSGGIFPEQRILINFQQDFIQPVSIALGLDLLAVFRPDFPVIDCCGQREEIHKLLTGLLHRKPKEQLEQADIKLRLSRLLLLLIKNQPVLVSEDETMAQVIAFVEQNHHEPLTLEQLARRFYLSRFTISRRFKAYAGISFVRYLTTVRLIHAKQLLEREELSITAVALRSGFESLSAFDRVFWRDMGMTPMEYKKQMKTKNRK